MGVIATTIGLLILSNIFMTFAWYAHLRSLNGRPWYVAAIVSWGIAFFEYMLMVPANRMGSAVYSVVQLKTIQEIITLSVFVLFSIFYLGESFHWKQGLGFAFIALGAFFIFAK